MSEIKDLKIVYTGRPVDTYVEFTLVYTDRIRPEKQHEVRFRSDPEGFKHDASDIKEQLEANLREGK